MKMTVKVSWHHHIKQKQQEQQPLPSIVLELFVKLGKFESLFIFYREMLMNAVKWKAKKSFAHENESASGTLKLFMKS